jgi:hypothetical protein
MLFIFADAVARSASSVFIYEATPSAFDVFKEFGRKYPAMFCKLPPSPPALVDADEPVLDTLL